MPPDAPVNSGQASDRRRPRGTLFNLLFAVIFIVMAVEVVLLIRQNRDLKKTVAELQARSSLAGEPLPALEEGDVVEPLELPSLNSGVLRVAYDDPSGETVLLIFSPDCPACRENMNNWKALEGKTTHPLYYVSTADEETTRGFAGEVGLVAPVLVADAGSLESYKVSYIPTTVVVGPGGIVKKVWVGMLPEGSAPGL